jgi:hypothetical protein
LVEPDRVDAAAVELEDQWNAFRDPRSGRAGLDQIRALDAIVGERNEFAMSASHQRQV